MTSTTLEAGVGQILCDQISSVVAIDDATLETLLVALLARGHVLIDGVPGVGKTLLAKTISRCVDQEFRRIQFTNDLMPADVVGSMVWKASTESFDFVPGPIFGNLVLADEINRTSPRTLSCLFEAMESGQVTVDGVDHNLPDPFLVLATRNPIEFHGTFPLPEATLDRFLVRIELTYPEANRELSLYLGEKPEHLLQTLEATITRNELLKLMAAVPAVHVSRPVAEYCHRIVEATRRHAEVALGASPRAAMAWLTAARARAVLQGREHVLPDDLKAMATAVLGHRVFRQDGGDARPLIDQLISIEPVSL